MAESSTRAGGQMLDDTDRLTWANTRALRAEDELARALEREAALERLCSDGLCLFGPDGHLRQASATAQRMLGLDTLETPLQSISFRSLCAEDGSPLPDDLNPILHALRSGMHSTGATVTWRRPDGELRRLALSLEPLTGGHDEPEVVAVVNDTADSTALARQLGQLMSDTVQQRHLLNLVFDNVATGIALCDSEDRLALCNRPFERIWGLAAAPEPSSLTMQALLAGVSWDFTGPQRRTFDALMAGARESFEPTAFDVETRSRSIHVYTCRLAGGRRLWALEDLTERRRMNQELRAAKDQVEVDRNLLRMVFANVEAAILVLDADDRTVAHNPRLAEMWGFDDDWLRTGPTMTELGERVEHLFAPGRLAAYQRRFIATLDDQQRAVMDIETTDGRYISVYGATMANRRLLFSFQDLTPRRRLESSLASRNEDLARALREREAMVRQLGEVNRQLSETDRLKSEFLANTSHELRTPLNSILGYLALILDGLYTNEDEIRQYAGTAHRSAQHLLEVINDLLDVARIESGRMEVRPEPVVLWLAIEEICASVKPQVKAKGLRLELPEQDLGLTASADPARLRQVLLNVIGNAVKFTETGAVVVTMGHDDEQAWVQVVDTGVGIPPDKLTTIFDKFVQADGSSARIYGGTGLGLAITRSLLELMGGRIDVQSAGRGLGCTATIELPLV